MSVVDEPPSRFLGDHAHGAYWYAPAGDDVDDDDDAHHTVSGRVIRLMWDYGVEVPLWDAEGLLPEDPAWLRAELGLSDALIEALTALGRDDDAVDDTPAATLATHERDRVRDDLGRRAQDVAEWLRREVEPRFEVVFVPW